MYIYNNNYYWSTVYYSGLCLPFGICQVIQDVESNADVKSIVLLSSKPGCWIAGADIK